MQIQKKSLQNYQGEYSSMARISCKYTLLLQLHWRRTPSLKYLCKACLFRSLYHSCSSKWYSSSAFFSPYLWCGYICRFCVSTRDSKNLDRWRMRLACRLGEVSHLQSKHTIHDHLLYYFLPQLRERRSENPGSPIFHLSRLLKTTISSLFSATTWENMSSSDEVKTEVWMATLASTQVT